MSKRIEWIVGIVVGLVSFAANPHGPLGGFWRPSAMSPMPTSGQLPFFMLLNVLESSVFALALVLLVFHIPKKALAPLSLVETRKAFYALLWLFGNWWLHDSLHMHIGMDLRSLLFIEYGFHVTMMISAGYLLWSASKILRAQK